MDLVCSHGSMLFYIKKGGAILKQIKAFGPQDLRMVETELPVIGAGEVLVDVRACGICGSDKWFWHVEQPSDYVAGHEVAGKVVAVGTEVSQLKVGDRVSINNVKGCGTCEACRAGQYVRCPHSLTHMGFGFSEKVAVPEANCLKLDPSISYVVGSLIFDNWGTPYSAIQRTTMKKGDTVVVTGCGPIGLAAIALSKQRGATVIAIDPLETRLKAAVSLGADKVLTPSVDTLHVIKTLSARDGADIFLECSGKTSSYELAFAALKIGGTLVSIGEGAKVEVNSSELIHKHFTWIGSLYSTMKDGQEIQELIVKGEIDPLAFVSHTFQLEELPSTFAKIINFEDGVLKAVVVRGTSDL